MFFYAIILISIVIVNNAPKLAPVKEKLSPAKLIRIIGFKIKKRSVKNEDLLKQQATVKDDAAEWMRIPTKIDMDALLSVDVSPDKIEGSVREKGDKK